MAFSSDADAILRHLEAHPDDEAARGALHDALLESDHDPVLAAGVHWLWVNKVWVRRAHFRSTTPDRAYYIEINKDLGIERRPFSEATWGATVGETLRAFSAYLWGFRAWVNDQLFGEAPVEGADKAGPHGVGRRLTEDESEAIRRAIEEADAGREAGRSGWPPTSPFVPWKWAGDPHVTWTTPRPTTSGSDGLWHYAPTTVPAWTPPPSAEDGK